MHYEVLANIRTITPPKWYIVITLKYSSIIYTQEYIYTGEGGWDDHPPLRAAALLTSHAGSEAGYEQTR